jgi:hypothetical protein
MPGLGPRCHDTRHRLIAPRRCWESSLPASHRCCPAACEDPGYVPDHPKITPSTATAATKSRPLSSLRRQLPRPEQPLPGTPPRQIPIDGRLLTQPPAGSFLGGFRTPKTTTSPRADRSRPDGIRNPSRLRTSLVLREIGSPSGARRPTPSACYLRRRQSPQVNARTALMEVSGYIGFRPWRRPSADSPTACLSPSRAFRLNA